LSTACAQSSRLIFHVDPEHIITATARTATPSSFRVKNTLCEFSTKSCERTRSRHNRGDQNAYKCRCWRCSSRNLPGYPCRGRCCRCCSGQTSIVMVPYASKTVLPYQSNALRRKKNFWLSQLLNQKSVTGQKNALEFLASCASNTSFLVTLPQSQTLQIGGVMAKRLRLSVEAPRCDSRETVGEDGERELPVRKITRRPTSGHN
jgi:hypothetical protein